MSDMEIEDEIVMVLAEIIEKVLYLRRKYHLGPIRIVWYLARYHGIKISDAGV